MTDTERALVARKTDSAPPVVACPWCVGFDPRAPEHRGTSHAICPACQTRAQAEIELARITKENR